ncbi:hypothetical protein BGZ83_009380 [Gryganskiella cystojenkinii]|nr:hypothetical protein BGZ83_009380 [Gryganskiella cystojenkinii]
MSDQNLEESLSEYLAGVDKNGGEPDGLKFLKSLPLKSRDAGAACSVWAGYLATLPKKDQKRMIKKWSQQKTERKKHWEDLAQEEQKISSNVAYLNNLQQRVNNDKATAANLNEVEFQQLVVDRIEAIVGQVGNRASSSTADTATEDIVDLDSPEVLPVAPPSEHDNSFHDLITYVFRKVKNKPASLPSSAPRGLSTNHEELYNAALMQLQEPGPVEAKKDVLVLLSAIINTLSPDARSFRLSKKIMAESSLIALDPESVIHTTVKDVLGDLLKALYPNLDKDQYSEPDFVNLHYKVSKMLSEAARSRNTQGEKAKYTTLLVVQQVILWIELKMFSSPTSEHVFVSAWTMLFNILLHDTIMRAIPGELASKASAGARQIAEQTYGSTTSTPCGRKIDLSVRIQIQNEWKKEIVIFEFKSPQATKQMLQRQQRKSVRLNAAILMDLEARGEHLRRYALDVLDGLSKTPLTPFGSDDDDEETPSPDDHPPAGSCTPPLKKRTNPFVLFSPSKKDKQVDDNHNDNHDDNHDDNDDDNDDDNHDGNQDDLGN